jgi:beta-glucosidase
VHFVSGLAVTTTWINRLRQPVINEAEAKIKEMRDFDYQRFEYSSARSNLLDSPSDTPMKQSRIAALLIVLVGTILTSFQITQSKVGQPALGTRSVKLIESNGLKFKDLNKNGALDPYEDWRLSAAQRSKDLLSGMSLEEKVGFLLISDIRMKNEGGRGASSAGPVTGEFNEVDVINENNIFTGKPLPEKVMSAAGTTKGINELHLRHFIYRGNTPPAVIASWANRLQELCEGTALGIPAIITSNPRNHVTNSATIGTSVGTTTFSKWPSELGLAAMRDLKLVREFADIARQEWAAVGIRKGYMYMGDVATEPRWQRIEGTFGENPTLAADVMREVVLGFQGEKLNSSSVALTTKHFPGGGATKDGFDPHYDYGKEEVFPGGMLEKNLLPFKAAIDAGTSAIMPYYSIPVGMKYEEVAYAYNKAILRDLLRGQLGFKGIINSDTGPINMMPWGVEDLSIEDRYAKALDAGVNIFSGNADPALLLKSAKEGKSRIAYIDESVLLLLEEKFNLGLFENPYVDEAKAPQIVGNPRFQERADLAQRKAIVLLRNENKALPLKPGLKIYFETSQRSNNPAASTGPQVYSNETYGKVMFVRTPDEADVILLWLKPAMRPLFPANDSPLRLALSECAIDVDYVNKLISTKPTVLAINYTSPFVIDQVFNEKSKSSIKGVVATFGCTPEALLDIVTGGFKPTGKMPFTTPISEDAVLKNKEDVPGYLEGDSYALFKYDEGLTFK